MNAIFITAEGGGTFGSFAQDAPSQAQALDSEPHQCASEQSDTSMSDQHLSGEVLDNLIRRAWVHAIYRRNSGHRAEYHKSMDIYRKLVAMKQGATQ